LTWSVTLVVRVTPPPVPVSRRVEVPVGVERVVVTVNHEDALVPLESTVTGFGEKVAVAPLGKPATDSVTAPAKPPLGAIVTPYPTVFPRTTVALAGDALKANDGSCAGAIIAATSDRIAGSVA
jgi:hypothetical protein